MSSPPNFHLAIIGGGLSGSLLTIELLARSDSGRALRIFNCDRDGVFGRGVPYGERHAQPGFLLIEDVARSTPVEFHAWLLRHRATLLAECATSPDDSLRAWAVLNAARFAAARWDELFVPRRWFGRFMRECHETALARASAAGVAQVELLPAECLDLQTTARGFELVLTGGRRISAGTVVLAPGNIPRRAPESPGLAQGYLHDLWRQGYDGLAELLHARWAALGRKLELVLMGSGATAGEVVYFLAHRPPLLEMIARIKVVSRSGYLAGGGAQLEPSSRPIRADAAARPAAREYVEASRRLALAGVLSTHAVLTTGAPRLLANGKLAIESESGAQAEAMEADVVINCNGSGAIDATSSALLANMLSAGRPFRANRLNTGFERRTGTFETAQVRGCFILGPLLNEEAIETHVESIHGVYRAVARLAPELHEHLLSRQAALPLGA